MGNKVAYEWRVNECDDNGDIMDCDFFETFAAAFDACDEKFNDIELVREIYNDDDGWVSRTHAEVSLSMQAIEERFDCGAPVPRRFHREVRKLFQERN